VQPNGGHQRANHKKMQTKGLCEGHAERRAPFVSFFDIDRHS
jgi:hypothetical protein